MCTVSRRRRKVIGFVIASTLCVFAWQLLQRYQHDNAVRSLERAGGTVRDDVSYPAWLPENILPSLAYAPFKRVTSAVQFSDVPVDDADLAALSNLTDVTWMELHMTSVEGPGLAAIADHSSLRRLFLNNNPITDSGLIHLKGLRNLEWLELGETSISDAGLQCLSELRRLERLGLVNTRITDAGLEHLQHLSELRRLELYGTDVTDASVPILSKMKGLTQVHLHNTKFTDEGLSALQTALPDCNIVK